MLKMEHKQRSGLLRLNDEFIRPTYAEFFYTEYLVQNWKTQTVLIEKLFLKTVMNPFDSFLMGKQRFILIIWREIIKLKNRDITKKDHKQKLSSYEGNHLEKLLESKMNVEVGQKINGPIDCDFLHVLAKDQVSQSYYLICIIL